MFIDVTRHGGVVLLRVAAAAIAYLSETPTGCAIHLIGGETIRANEGRDEIEARVDALTTMSAITEVMIEPPVTGPAAVLLEKRTMPTPDLMPPTALQARPTGQYRGRKTR
jgi:hypothetical protein